MQELYNDIMDQRVGFSMSYTRNIFPLPTINVTKSIQNINGNTYTGI